MLNFKRNKKNYVNKKRLLKRLGYLEKNQKMTRTLSKLIDAIIELANILIHPKQIINISNIKNITETEIVLDKNFIIRSSKVAKLFNGCSKALSFLVTIGPKLEEKRNSLIAQKETTQSFILDACGSEACESIAEELNRSIEKDFAKEGFQSTKRYSPGYGDWHISAQKDFLEFLDSGQIGVRLTETFIMQPEKSVSAVIGLSPENK